MGSRVEEYDYALPPELIAEWPTPDRDGSRMLVLHREDGRIEHRRFRDLPAYIREGDIVVLNDARVIPARLMDDTGRIEILLVREEGPGLWIALVRPGRRMRAGDAATVGGSRVEVREVLGSGERLVAFEPGVDPAALGKMPLPPYIRREVTEADLERYQTVYARVPGAVAAPTAGLHFTPELLRDLPHAFVTLLVGPGTFRPVRSETVTGHRMDPERYAIGEETAARVTSARRVLAVGTTVVRALEGSARGPGRVRAGRGEIDLFIHPPFEFRVTGALLTNFHLPRSTLLMLVSAFGGIAAVRRAYAEAVRERYRFYSYGDCMLIV